ncbi:MAG: hypothetical protein ISS49_09240 [Anaerolineae bacterium]|nr:hypothetical protein [Anaerolineae bacterium]
MAEAQVATSQVATLNLDELKEVIRNVVREEVIQALEAWAGYFEPTIIEPGSPIHEDLKDIKSYQGRSKGTKLPTTT